jgi:hypothetical protein
MTYDELAQLAELRDAGAITDTEFATLRARLLGSRAPSTPTNPGPELGSKAYYNPHTGRRSTGPFKSQASFKEVRTVWKANSKENRRAFWGLYFWFPMDLLMIWLILFQWVFYWRFPTTVLWVLGGGCLLATGAFSHCAGPT